MPVRCPWCWLPGSSAGLDELNIGLWLVGGLAQGSGGGQVGVSPGLVIVQQAIAHPPVAVGATPSTARRARLVAALSQPKS